jgi:hypothetical protein
MRTITFYSYKGGVGRSLLVANAAKYLSTLGKNVFALDLDLEAPGLIYKFELGPDAIHSASKPGVVDILASFIEGETFPNSLEEFSSALNVTSGAGKIQLMQAGTAPDASYWRCLSQINWNEILYGANPVGVPFFLELKERIRSEYNPDFLLIDARTGITEMGGIATTILPDTVVCLGLASIEHLEGLRAVMRGIVKTTTSEDASVKLLAAISRLPIKNNEDLELVNALNFLNAPVRDGVPGLALDEVIALHSEPLLDVEEQLLVGGKNSPHDLPLLRDYLRLFSKMIPAEDIRPHVGKLVQQAIGRLLDNPDQAQSELESLTAYCADEEAYRALLKLYRVSKAPIDKLLATASLMWQLGGPKSVADALQIDIVTQAFSDPRVNDSQKRYAEFGEAIWRSTGMKDMRVGMSIVNAYVPEKKDRAIRLLMDYLDQISSPNYLAVIRLIELLGSGATLAQAYSVIERFKVNASFAQFHVAWARLAVDHKDAEQVGLMLSDKAFNFDTVRAIEPSTAYRFLKVGGVEGSLDFLREALESAAVRGETSQLRALGECFYEEGLFKEFEANLNRWAPSSLVEDVIDTIRRRVRRPRALSRWEQHPTEWRT